MNGGPWAKLRRERPPGAAVAQQIPQGVKMPVQRGFLPARRHKVVVSGPEGLGLIFLAAHGADPA